MILWRATVTVEMILWRAAVTVEMILWRATVTEFVLHKISKYVDVQQSGVKQHPFTFQWTGNEYCLTALHHLSVKDYGEQHKKQLH